MELWDIYDEHRQKTGRTHERGVPLANGDYHLVVHVWIVGSDGRFLIQRRQPWKRSWPDLWDCAAAGAAQVGDDSLRAALRETEEELGLALEESKMKLLFTVDFDNGFDDHWLCMADVRPEELELQYEEVAQAKWATEEEIRALVSGGAFIPFDYLERVFLLARMHRGGQL